jgi:hypothetical protein
VLLGALPAHLLGFAGEVGSRRSVLLAGSCGLAGVLLAGGAIAVALLRRRRLEFSAVVLLGWIAYSVAVAGITGLFRSASFGISNSLTPRYAIWSSLFWAGLLALLPPVFARAESRYGSKRARIATASAAVALAALAWPSHRHWIGVVAERTRLGDETALSLMVGADDPDRQRWHLYRDLDRVHATASELRRRRWNLFRPDWTLLAGTRLADRYRESADPGRVVGAFSLAAIAASTADAGWHVEGWAWDARAGRPPRRIVLVDSSGVVRGLATFTQDATATVQQALPEPGLLARALRRVHPFLPASLGLGPGFFGYVQAGTDVDGLRALAVLDDERTAVPLDAAAPPKAAQRPLPAP